MSGIFIVSIPTPLYHSSNNQEFIEFQKPE